MQTQLKTKTALRACAFLSILGASISSAYAQETQIDIVPTNTIEQQKAPEFNQANDTHPPLKISPDKSELIRLDQEAGSIIIGSPDHLSVLADSTKTLVLVPQIPGATYITILDKKGNILMQRHVIIASPKEKYVRIRNSCNGNTESCEPTQVYYCPDTCHKVNVAQEATKSERSGENDSNINNTGGAENTDDTKPVVDSDN